MDYADKLKWTKEMGENCWQLDGQKSYYGGDGYSFYEAVVDGFEYSVKCHLCGEDNYSCQ